MNDLNAGCGMRDAGLRTAIRKALAGSSSQSPVDTKSLLKLGKSDAVTFVLESMLASREINSAVITKGATRTVMCWLTGSVGLVPAFQIRTPPLAPPTRQPEPLTAHVGRAPPDIIKHPASGIARPTTSTKQPKEKDMGKHAKQHPATSQITLELLAIVAEQPGIDRETAASLAMKRAPGATEDQARKAISNLVHSSKKLRAEGTRYDHVLFLNDGTTPAKPETKPAKSETKVKPKTSKVVAKKAAAKPAKPLPASKPATCPKSQVNGESAFHIMLLENGYVQIQTASAAVELSPAEMTRAHRFIGRITQSEIGGPA